MSQEITVTAGILERDGRYLICQRRSDGAFPLRWEFPGGKVEPGEDKPQAIARELREELGVEARVGDEVFQTRHRYPEGLKVDLTVFRIESFEGDPRNLAFEAICWVKPDRLESFDFLAADRALIRWLAEQRRPAAPAEPVVSE